MSNSLDARERKEGEKDGRKEGGISREMTPFRGATSHVSTRRREAKRATATANAGKVFHFLAHWRKRFCRCANANAMINP